MKKLVYILLSALLLAGGCLAASCNTLGLASRTNKELLMDPQLESAVKRAEGRARLTEDFLRDITGLSIPDSNLDSLYGITKCENLEYLDVSSNNISYLGSVSVLKKLTELNLAMNNVEDLSPLSGLSRLSVLNLDSNSISDIGPLVENTGLGEGDLVILENNPLSDESVDKYIPRLQERGVAVRW